MFGAQGRGSTSTYEQNLIVELKKELELLHKELLTSIFRDDHDSDFSFFISVAKADSLKMGGAIDMKMVTMIEKLENYCDDHMSPQLQAFNVSRVRLPEEQKKEEKKMPQPPIHAGLQVIQGTPDKRHTAKIMQPPSHTAKVLQPPEMDRNRSPTKPFISNGPIKATRDLLKGKPA